MIRKPNELCARACNFHQTGRWFLSVGAINRYHKRMHYLVEEIARLAPPRPFLQNLGAPDPETKGVIKLADELLGREN